MTKNKSIDGLTPKRVQRTISASKLGDPGFETGFVPPRRTTKSNRTQKSPTKTHQIPIETPSNSPLTRAEITEDFLNPTKSFDFNEETGELVAATSPEKAKQMSHSNSKNSKTAKNPKKPRKKWSTKRKVITWIIAILIILLAAGAIWFVLWGNDLLARITGGRGNIADLFTETYEPLQADENGRTNILLFGTSGFDMSGTEYSGGIHDGAELTDSIMIVSFDQNTGAADLISLPRDLKVDAGCNYTGKINEVYYCNNLNGDDEAAGATALAEQITHVLGLEIPYYAHVNWGSLESIVNSLGGITITLDESVADYGYTNAIYEADTPYHLDGEAAVGLSRARHGTENGDFSRGAFQQKILLGIKDRILEEGLSVSQLINLSSTLGDNLRTNFTVGELKSLAHLATTIDWHNITEVSFLEPDPLLTDGMIGGISYVYPTAGVADFSAIQAYIKQLLTPASESDPANPDDSNTSTSANS